MQSTRASRGGRILLLAALASALVTAWLQRADLGAPAAVTLSGIVDADPATGWVEVQDPSAGLGATPAPAAGRPVARDVPYVVGARPGCAGSGDDVACSGSQTLDVYRARGTGAHPVVLWLHSGGWVSGDKLNLEEPVLRLHRQGWDVVAVNYRLAAGPRPSRFPAAIHDAKAAVRWVKVNASRFDIDTDALVVMGGSAGGYLALMVATTAGELALEPAGLSAAEQTVDSRVAAAVSLSGMCDLCSMLADGHNWSPELVRALLGCSTDCPTTLLEAASPAHHVTPDDAPVYAITGADDTLALPAVSDLLGDAYARAGIGQRFFDDAVDSGDPRCWGHDPWCGTNVVALDAFMAAVVEQGDDGRTSGARTPSAR